MTPLPHKDPSRRVRVAGDVAPRALHAGAVRLHTRVEGRPPGLITGQRAEERQQQERRARGGVGSGGVCG